MHVRLNGPAGDLSLPSGYSILGRGHDCQLRINDPRLSRHHSRFHHDGTQVWVEDLGSTNGVLVNGDRIAGRSALKSGDVVVCGPCVFTVTIDPTRIASPSELLPSITREPDPHATDTMNPLELPEGSARTDRRLDPKIAAALSSEGSDASSDTLSPSDDTKPATGALEGSRKNRALPDRPLPEQPRAETPPKQHTTDHRLRPADFKVAESVALQADFVGDTDLTPPSRWQRLLAGPLDALSLSLVAVLFGGPVLLAAYGWALVQAGAGMEHGLPVLGVPPAQAADFSMLAGSLLSVDGWGRAISILGHLSKAADQQPFLTFFAVGTIATLITVMVLLLGSVAATVVRGAPFWHRRLGLEIVELHTGYNLTWGRATVRWLLVVLLWPLAIPFAITGHRAPHDLLCGSKVRSQKR